jgi:hypothetical protein
MKKQVIHKTITIGKNCVGRFFFNDLSEQSKRAEITKSKVIESGLVKKLQSVKNASGSR